MLCLKVLNVLLWAKKVKAVRTLYDMRRCQSMRWVDARTALKFNVPLLDYISYC